MSGSYEVLIHIDNLYGGAVPLYEFYEPTDCFCIDWDGEAIVKIVAGTKENTRLYARMFELSNPSRERLVNSVILQIARTVLAAESDGDVIVSVRSGPDDLIIHGGPRSCEIGISCAAAHRENEGNNSWLPNKMVVSQELVDRLEKEETVNFVFAQ